MQKNILFFSAENFPVIVEKPAEGSIAERMGILANDRILQINADTIHSFEILQHVLRANKNEDILVFVYRNTDILTLQGTLDSTGMLGIHVLFPYQQTDYTLGSALAYGYKDAMVLLRTNAKGLGKIFTGKEKATESIQGPIGMARIYGSTFDWAWFWRITGILSLIFAFMNFLPIPALDGGHILFVCWEIVTRRRPSDKFFTVTQQIGMVIIFALMFFAISNDLFKIFR